jgi:hypothetical protein
MTIAYGEGYHLYAECLDNKYVYLKVEGGEMVESFGSEFHRSRHPDAKPEMVYRIPTKIAEQLFESDLPVLGEGCIPLRDLETLK